MEEIIYITPNGTEVDEATLRNQFGDLFDQLVASGQLKKKDFTQDTVSQSQVGTSDLPEPEVSTEELGFFERNLGESGFTDLLDDTITNIRQGFAQGASLNEALKLQRKGLKATKEDVEDYVQAVNRMQSIPVTDEMRDFQRIYEENDKSWLGFIKGIGKNPSVLSGVIAQSVASMLNPTVAFGAVKGAGTGAVTGAAGGMAVAGPAGALVAGVTGAKLGAVAGLTNALEGGLAFTEFLQEEINKNPNLEFNDEGIAAILNDDEAFRRVKTRTKARGYSIAFVNALTAGVAGQLARSGRNIKRLGDLKVGGVTVPTSRVLPGPQTAIRSGTEFVGGGLGEVAGRAAAGQEMDVAEIGFEAFGELGAPETIIPSFRNATYEVDGERVTRDDVIDIIEGNPDIETLESITIKNDSALENDKNELYQRVTVEREVMQGLTKEQQAGITDEQKDKLVELTIDYKTYSGSNTPEGNRNANKVNEQIKQITDAIQEPSTEEVDVQELATDSQAVGEGDTQQQPIAREDTPEQIEFVIPVPGEKPAEEIEAEVEVTPSEVETYTLPENPIEAKKDFEILDNRDGLFQGLEEDGSNKWIVRNIKTDFIGTTKTKTEAQQFLNNTVKREGMTMDYGEGQPVLEEFRTQVTEEVVDAPIEAAPTDKVRQIGNFEVIITEDNVIKSIKKNGKEVSDQGRRNAEKQIIQAGEIDVTKGKKAQLDKGMSPTEVSELILRESSNPTEIATEIALIKEKKKSKKRSLQERKQSGLPSLFGTKFTPESIIDVFGIKPSELGQGFTRTWVSKTGENLNDGFIDPNGIKFDKDQVAEFLQQNPSEAQYNREFLNKLPQLQKDLENKFEEITGITPTEGNIKLASSPETIAEVAEKTIFEAERKAEEKPIIDKKEKQTVPKIKDETKKETLPTEIDKTIDELGAKGVDKINAKILRLNFGNAYAYIKNTLAKGKGVINVMQEQLRSAPTTAVDYILGNENSTLFYRKLFLPLVKSYQQYADKFRQKQKIILEAQDSLLKESKGNRNKAKISGYKIAIAQKAKIHESNPDSKVTPPVVDLLNFTIKLGKAGKLNGVNKRTALELEKLRDEYLEDGVISFEKVYNSLTPTQKKVYNKLQSENKNLEPFAKRAAARRGMTLEMLNDYSHRVVLATRNKEIDVLEEQSKEFSGETTRARNILERTEGVKAVSFDPFLSSLRGTQEVYLDYYMSPDISKVQQIAAGLVKKYENGNEGQVAATVGIEETIRELLRVTYLRSFVPSGYGTSIATEAKRIGYRLLLGSAPRFVAELAGNSAMLLAEKPSVVREAVTKYSKFSMGVGAKANNKFINALTELGSGETDKLGGILTADSKYTDRSGVLNISDTQGGLYNPVLNKMDQLSRMPKKLTYDVVARVSDFLMAGGDRVISRPIWISKFANEFKQNVKNDLGEDINLSVKDFDEISNGTSKYLKSKYRKSREKAVTDSDRTVINISTSANPFNAIAKNVKRGDVKDYYRTINSFMANFTLNEYATARQAIGALVNSGEMSPTRAGFLLTGVLARMSSYVIAYGILADLMDEEIFKAPKEEDEKLDSLIYRQLIGSVMTLMFRQNLGNIPSLPVNLGIEEFNKQYLQELRDGKPYNSYDNSIVYSLITLDRLDKGIDKQILPILTGPYVEYYKTARRAIELYNRKQTRKTKEARDRAVKELEEVIVPQIIGQLGFIPLYKDYVRSKRKKFYKENYESPSSGGTIQTPADR
jgi:hypothetical protein